MNMELNVPLELNVSWGAWVAQSVEQPTLARVMISRSMSSSPVSGSVLTAQSLEPASDSVSPPLSTPPPLMLCLSLSKINKLKKKKKDELLPGAPVWLSPLSI